MSDEGPWVAVYIFGHDQIEGFLEIYGMQDSKGTGIGTILDGIRQ